MGGMALGKSVEQILKEREALKKDPADIPMNGNRLSPKQQYEAIQQDIKFLKDEIPISGYKRMFPFGSTKASKRAEVESDLRKDAEVGRYVEPGYGDLGQFLKKGGKVKGYAKGGSVRGAGCEQRGLRKCKVI